MTTGEGEGFKGLLLFLNSLATGFGAAAALVFEAPHKTALTKRQRTLMEIGTAKLPERWLHQ